jgi:hypothetical protein
VKQQESLNKKSGPDLSTFVVQGCQMVCFKRFGYIWERLGMENVGIFYGPLDFFTANVYILCMASG